ncbi:MAG: hypothetical protein AABX11_06025 [Nanoarchaeota archaeon]
MSRYKMSLQDARRLQKWAIETSGAKKFLDSLPKFPKTKKIKEGLYVSYEIDKDEIEDDGLDYCTPEIASVWIVDDEGEETKLGGIRAYNWETYWLEFDMDCEVDNAENWWALIKEEYKKLHAEVLKE